MNKADLINSLYVFMLAAFIGFEVIRRVSPLLHTPLMSLTNVAATSNAVGGFIITDRMLKMFKTSRTQKP